jgi:hypothetical protein
VLDIKSAVGAALAGDSALTALVPAARIRSTWPSGPAEVPCICFLESQRPRDYADDAEASREATVEVHAFTGAGASTTPIASRTDVIMAGLGFTVEFSEDVPEPEDGFRHRLIRYRGVLTADDLD